MASRPQNWRSTLSMQRGVATLCQSVFYITVLYIWPRRRNDQKAPKSFICSSSAHPQRPAGTHVFPNREMDISLEPPRHLHEKSIKMDTQKCCFVAFFKRVSYPRSQRRATFVARLQSATYIHVAKMRSVVFRSW